MALRVLMVMGEGELWWGMSRAVGRLESQTFCVVDSFWFGDDA